MEDSGVLHLVTSQGNFQEELGERVVTEYTLEDETAQTWDWHIQQCLQKTELREWVKNNTDCMYL